MKKYQIYKLKLDSLESMGIYYGKNPQDAVNSMGKSGNLVGGEFGNNYLAIPHSKVQKHYTPIVK